MKLIVYQEYTADLSAEYPLSSGFEKWLAGQLKSRVKPSDRFLKKYGKDWDVTFYINTSRELSAPKIWKPGVFRKTKEIEWMATFPFIGCESVEPVYYSKTVRLIFETIALMLKQLEIDSSKILEDLPALMGQFNSNPKMVSNRLFRRFHQRLESDNDVAETEDTESITKNPSKPKKKRKPAMPKWRVPKGLNKIVEEEGSWEDERFDPILLTVMSGTSYQGRKIPLAWQIEFEPGGERLDYANKMIEELGGEPDGDGWSDIVMKQFAKKHPSLIGQLHSDSESSTCVLWVESERACQVLLELVWSLIYPKA